MNGVGGKPIVREWTSTGPRPCKRCRQPISAGDQWASRVEGWARLCIACLSQVGETRESLERKRDASERRRSAEHRLARRHAILRGEVL
jgi:methylphosphotriester-DNA--protein-cysteine methyltransferase